MEKRKTRDALVDFWAQQGYKPMTMSEVKATLWRYTKDALDDDLALMWFRFVSDGYEGLVVRMGSEAWLIGWAAWIEQGCPCNTLAVVRSVRERPRFQDICSWELKIRLLETIQRVERPGKEARRHQAEDILKMLEDGAYCVPASQGAAQDTVVRLGDWAEDVTAALPYAPEMLSKLSTPPAVQALLRERRRAEPCKILLETTSSFASRVVTGNRSKENIPLVMNFANARHPGGGFLHGARAQEEDLCRSSTLYASLSSRAAKAMYRYNRVHAAPEDSDFMLLSPEVLVVRERGRFLPKPRRVAVATVAAPNRNGRAGKLKDDEIAAVLHQRLRRFFCMAAQRGYRDLVLGAWGCGAFGNDPRMVAKIFHELLFTEGFAWVFRKVSFAILGGGKNYEAFVSVFKG